MSVEMACGNCQGRFLVSAAGTVACPHCGTHLLISPENLPPAGEENPSPPELQQQVIEPPEPAEAFLARYAGLADIEQSAPAEFNVVAGLPTDADVVAGLPTEPQETRGGNQAQDAAEVEPQETEEPRAAASAAPDAESPQKNVESDAGQPVARPAAAERMDIPATETSEPDFSTFDLPGGPSEEGGRSTDEPSFDFEVEEPTVAFSDPNWSHEGMTGDEPPSSMFALAASPYGDTETAEAFPDFSGAADDDEEEDNVDAVLAAASSEAIIGEGSSLLANEPPPLDERRPAAVATTAQAVQGPLVPRMWFLLLASYASAMTIVCLWLLLRGAASLSLEDPAETPVINNKKAVKLYPVDMQMPRGHVLQLGESRRFGNIVVKPMKVTRGPLDFAHFSDEEGAAKEATPPVLKLWLQFTNESNRQTIAPLDSLLLYQNRVRSDTNYDEFRANTFVCRQAEKKRDGDLVYVFALNTNDVWDLRGQHLDKKLGPGESVVTYVPTTPEGIDELTGDLVWRLHFRKGYSPSNRGLTTLIEVDFHSDDIQAEPSTPARQPTAAL